MLVDRCCRCCGHHGALSQVGGLPSVPMSGDSPTVYPNGRCRSTFTGAKSNRRSPRCRRSASDVGGAHARARVDDDDDEQRDRTPETRHRCFLRSTLATSDATKKKQAIVKQKQWEQNDGDRRNETFKAERWKRLLDRANLSANVWEWLATIHLW